MLKFTQYIVLILILTSCSLKQPQVSQSVTVLLKTPTMKFYDKGFISKYEEYTQLQIFNAGTLVLDLSIYEDKVCKSMLQCISLKEFNKENLHYSYEDTFIKKLLDRNDKKIVFKDKKNKILIKIYR